MNGGVFQQQILMAVEQSMAGSDLSLPEVPECLLSFVRAGDPLRGQ